MPNAGTSRVSQSVDETYDFSASNPRTQVYRAVHLLDPYVQRQADGTFTVNAPKSIVDAIPAGVYQTVMASTRKVNSLIKSGELASTPSKDVYVTGKGAAYGIQSGNHFQSHWWGIELDLDSNMTNRVEGLMNAGAGGAALVAVLAAEGVISSPGAFPSGAASAIMWMGAGVVQACSNSNGVQFYMTWNGAPWCGGN